MHSVCSITVQYLPTQSRSRTLDSGVPLTYVHLVRRWLHQGVLEGNLNVNANNELQVTCDIPVPYTHSEVSGHHHWKQEISFYLRSLNRFTLSFPKPLRSKPIRLPRISRIWGPTKIPSFSSAVLMMGNLLLRYWNLLNLSYRMAFTTHLNNSSFTWRGRGTVFIGLTRGWTPSFPGS